MRLLVDTHCWLWWLLEPTRLPKSVSELIADPLNDIYLSCASAWEIGIKCQLGKLKLPEPAQDFVPSQLGKHRMKSLEIHTIHALHAAALPLIHRDPFDRILVAQSALEKMSLITGDAALRRYEEHLNRELIWAGESPVTT